MRAAHGLILTFVLTTGALGVALAMFDGSPLEANPTRPDRGELAPPADEPVPTVVVARIDGGEGPLVDVAAVDGSLALLTRHRWFIQRGSFLRGGFGDPTPGSPGWLARPESIALSGGRVFILDAGRHALSVWDTCGVRLRDLPLAEPEALSVLASQVLVTSGGDPVVVSFRVDREGVARWEARAYSESDPGRLVFSLEGTGDSFAFDRPFLARGSDGLVGVRALRRELFRVSRGGTGVEPYPDSGDPPLWSVPRGTRQRYNALVRGRGGGGYQALLELPPFWPAVRDFTVTREGALLLAVPVGEERQHLELLDREARPGYRFNLDGYLDPVFLDGGRAFLVREESSVTVVHELLFQPS